MKKLPERVASELDEAEMRAFYAGCGISKATTESAIKAWRNRGTVEQDNKKKVPLRSKKPKVVA